MLRPLRLKTEISQICPSKEFLCDLARLKWDQLQLCAARKRYVVICSTEKIMLQVLRLKMSMLGLCRTKEKFYNFALPKKIYFATLCKRNFPCDLSASKQICCDFECTKKVCATNPTSQQNRFVAMLLDRLAICN